MLLKRGFFKAVLLISIVLLLCGCTTSDPRETASTFAEKRKLVAHEYATDWISLQGWQRITPPVTRLRVYIEGDGFAWVSRTRPSDDPTPRNPIGLQLAAADPSANVLYLARPCQFIGPPLPPACKTSVWTDQRFSDAVVAAMDSALTQVKAQYPQVEFELVGYSGGGNIAALLAARRQDVQALRTVAGNLDVAYVNTLHHVTPMPDAQSAINVAPALKNLPQIHFSGADDNTVPPAVAGRFRQATGARCAQVALIPGMDHGGNWAALWPQLLGRKVGCK